MRGTWRLWDLYYWVLAVAVLGAIAAGSLRPLARFVTGPGWAAHGTSGRLFVVATLLLLLGGLAQLSQAAGPVTASSAFRFWLLAAPVGRRSLLRRRLLALIAVIAGLACLLAALVAHAASVTVLPAVAVAALGAITVTAGAVWAQASEAAERGVHVAGRALGALSVLGFGSLATGLGRAGAVSALREPPTALTVVLVLLAVAALTCGWRGYRALGRIDVSVLSRGQGLWTAGRAAAASLDVFLLADFLSEQNARTTGRVRSARVGGRFLLGLLRSEWARLRRRPRLAVGAAAAAIVWWGCRQVLPAPALAAVALITGYFLVMPLAGTLRQLASSPGLRAQFAPQDRWLNRVSIGICLLAASAWTAVTVPGLAAQHSVAVIAIVIAAGITAAAARTVTRPPLDYSVPPVPTPFGDLPLDLWRQQARGLLLLAVIILIVLRVG